MGQEVKFHKNDDFIKVGKGTTVSIEADSAYVVSGSRVRFINNQLDALDSIHTLYNQLADNRNELFDQLKKTNKALTRLGKVMKSDSTLLSGSVGQILTDLELTLNDLKSNNQQLKLNNNELEQKAQALEGLVKQLRKETRAIWIDGLWDKVLAFAGGVGVGILIIAI